MKPDFKTFDPAFRHLQAYPRAKLAWVARHFSLAPNDLAEAISHYFGQASDIPESYAEIAAIHLADDPVLAATTASVEREAREPEPSNSVDRRKRAPAAPVPFKPSPELPADFIALQPPRSGPPGVGYDAIFRADTSRPMITFRRAAGTTIKMIEGASAPGLDVVCVHVDLEFSPSTRQILVRKRNGPGGFNLRFNRGIWSISSNQLKLAPVPGKYLARIVANRADHLVLAPVDLARPSAPE